MTHKNALGFSLLEVFVALSLASVLMSIAVPSFASLIHDSRLKTTSFEMIKTLHLARNTAITSGQIVMVCKSTGVEAKKCVKKYRRNSSWANGWLVFIDLNSNNEFDDTDTIVNQTQAPRDTGVVFNQSGRLRFFPNGSARSAGFYICGAHSSLFRHIKLLHTGRARVVENDANNKMNLCKSSIADNTI